VDFLRKKKVVIVVGAIPPSHIFLHDVHNQLLHRGCVRLGLIGCGLWLAVWLIRERGSLVTLQDRILLRKIDLPMLLCVLRSDL
jgi:hypothetical protein